MSDQEVGALVGRILPSVGGGKPIFQILNKHSQYRDRNDTELAGVRPCAHPRFILDAEWNTVTCGECKERLDAFAVLLRHAEYLQEMAHERDMAQWAHVKLLCGLIRRDVRAVCISPERRAGALAFADKRAYCQTAATVDELQAFHRELEREILDARTARRRARQTHSTQPGGAA